MTKIKIALGAVALLVVGFALGVYGDRASNTQSSLGQNNYQPLYQVGDLYQGMNQTLLARNGNIVGVIVQTVTSLVNVISNIVTNNLIQGSGGFSNTFSTSTTLTTSQFCLTTNQRWLNTTALATSTLPAATTTYAACGSSVGFGAWNDNWITNDSTNTVNIVPGTGMKFKCETNGVGTTTIIGGCSTSLLSMPASTTLQIQGWWDGASSTMYLNVGNMYY